MNRQPEELLQLLSEVTRGEWSGMVAKAREGDDAYVVDRMDRMCFRVEALSQELAEGYEEKITELEKRQSGMAEAHKALKAEVAGLQKLLSLMHAQKIEAKAERDMAIHAHIEMAGLLQEKDEHFNVAVSRALFLESWTPKLSAVPS